MLSFVQTGFWIALIFISKYFLSQAQLLPSAESFNRSPFDKDFSFDFSSDLLEGVGYHPTSYSLDPPCPSGPPCSGPCHCWQKEEDSGVETEETGTSSKSRHRRGASCHNNTINTLSETFTKSASVNLQQSSTGHVLLEGLASLKNMPQKDINKIFSPPGDSTKLSSFKGGGSPSSLHVKAESLPLNSNLSSYQVCFVINIG